MRYTLLIGCAVLTMFGSTPSTAQYYGGVPMGRTLLPACYDPDFQPSTKNFPNFRSDADKAMDKYLGLARTSSNLDKMFTGTKGNRLMLLDGTQLDTRSAKDPWASRIARLEPVGYVLSNEELNILAQWKAFASDGALLGTYQGLLRVGIGGYHFRQLKLTSAASGSSPDALKSFCMTPGDIEDWQAKKAERDAKRTAQAR